MSRVGKNPVAIPSGVTVGVEGRNVKVAGPKGTLTHTIPHDITAKVEGNEVTFTPKGDAKRLSAAWGTARALVRNMVEGVTNGYSIKMKLVGVGYRASMQGSKLNLALGYSHPVNMDIPQGIAVEVSKDQTELTISGADKHAVGMFAAEARAKRPPEPFKGKGLRYAAEYINMKEGKKK
ncbi:MAG: 50S ribosomal protein L6 [Pseudomonadaceae bacterium]|nr:50S ribosomal protein L6 [Pseudomonadaceae bacterium]